MTFPTTQILDNFNRANENPLANGWLGPWRENNANQLQILSNAVVAQVGNILSSSYLNTTFGADMEVWCTVTSITLDISPCVRMTSPGTTVSCYVSDINAQTGGWQLYKEVSGAFTAIGGSTTQAISAGDGVGLSVVGSLVTMWYRSGGVWSAIGTPQTDSAITGTGFIGLSLNHSSTICDNFGGGTVVTGDDEANRIARRQLGARPEGL